MKVTEVRVRLVNDKTERLKAFCCMTIDGEFVVRDIKVIEGTQGLFVAMPSRKITDHCPSCGGKNPLRAQYCNDCGAKLKGGKFEHPPDSSDKLHADIAHPINSECRARIQKAILDAYYEELGGAGRPQPEESFTPPQEPPAQPPAEEPQEKGEQEEQEEDRGFAEGIL